MLRHRLVTTVILTLIVIAALQFPSDISKTSVESGSWGTNLAFGYGHVPPPPPGNLINPGFETGNLSGWSKGTVVQFAGVVAADGYATPYNGNYMARLGAPIYFGQPIGNNTIYQDFIVVAPTLSFVYNIFTYDYTGYNHFHYLVKDLTTGTNIVYYSQGAWGSGTGLKSTGWRTVNINLSGYMGKLVRFEIAAGGTGDTIYGTWAYVDEAAAPSNQPPTANAGGPYTVEEGGSVNLNGTGSDPNGDPITFAWDLDNNGSFETPGQTVTFSAGVIDAPATRTVVLKVSDNKGAFAISSATINIVLPPTPTFSINPPVPPGTCICTPLLMNTNSSGAEHLFFKADSSGTAALRLYAHSVNVTDPSNVVAKVFDTVTGLQVGPTLTASYPVGTAPGTEVNTDGNYTTVTGRVYRVKVTTPNTPPSQPHYRMRFNGVVGAAINSPTFASLEPAAPRVQWFLNHGGGDLKLRIFSVGVPTPLTPENESVNVQIFFPVPTPPNTPPLLNQVVNVPIPPGIDQVFTLPGAAAGQYRVRLVASHHYRLEKLGGADTAIYMGANTYGFGSLSGTIQTSGGAPFPTNVQVKLLLPGGAEEASTVAPTGSYTFSNLFVGPRRVEIIPPPGTNVVSPSFFDVSVSCEQTRPVPPFVLNRSPVVSLPATTTLNEGSSAVIVATASDPDGNPLTFTWTLTGGGTLTPSGNSAIYSNSDGPATAMVQVTINDGFGGTATATGSVQTMNVAPSVNAGPDASNISGQVHQVNATYSDPGVPDTHTATIDWGDGSPVQNLGAVTGGTVNASHQYFKPSEYTIKVCVTDDDGGTGCDTLIKTVKRLQVTINIKPGSNPNSINLKALVPVAILTTPYFDATQVNVATVRFGPVSVLQAGGGGTEVHDQGHVEDSVELDETTHDGDLDMVLHFDASVSGLTETTSVAYVWGVTNSGVFFEGSDAVRIPPGNNQTDPGTGSGKGPK